MITNFRGDQNEVLRSILNLYLPGSSTFDADITYGSGGFYKGGIPRPPICFDKQPRFNFVVEANSTELDKHVPLSSLRSIVYDPPYIHAPGKESIMGQRFGGYKSYKERDADYIETLASAHKVLKENGILVFKCQDIVEGGRQYFNHCKVWYWATENGDWEVEDLFMTHNPRVIKGWNHGVQQHARKVVCYFWVLKKVWSA